jgi:hypothetical protein
MLKEKYMKNLYIITLLTSVLLLNSGCATYMAKKHWNKAQQENAIRVEADGEQVMVGVDLTAMTYLKDNWKWAVPAAVLDAAVIYGGYQVYEGLTDDSDTKVDYVDGQNSSSGTGGRDGTAITVNGDGNTVQVRGDETNFAE